MKRTPLNKIGRKGRANLNSRKKIAEIAEEKGLNSCEVRFDGCLVTFGIAPAHRHRRGYYNGDEELLADFRQWVACCQYCHNILDGKMSKEESEDIFYNLRGEE